MTKLNYILNIYKHWAKGFIEGFIEGQRIKEAAYKI